MLDIRFFFEHNGIYDAMKLLIFHTIISCKFLCNNLISN